MGNLLCCCCPVKKNSNRTTRYLPSSSYSVANSDSRYSFVSAASQLSPPRSSALNKYFPGENNQPGGAPIAQAWSGHSAYHPGGVNYQYQQTQNQPYSQPRTFSLRASNPTPSNVAGTSRPASTTQRSVIATTGRQQIAKPSVNNATLVTGVLQNRINNIGTQSQRNSTRRGRNLSSYYCNNASNQGTQLPSAQLPLSQGFTSTGTTTARPRRTNASLTTTFKNKGKKPLRNRNSRKSGISCATSRTAGKRGKTDIKQGTPFVPKNPPAPKNGTKQENGRKYNEALNKLSAMTSASSFDLRRWLRFARVLERGTEEYEIIATYVNNSQVHGFGVFIMSVVRLARRDEIEFRRREDFDPLEYNRHLLWHGTKNECVSSIMENGFKLPEKSNILLQGKGIYFADRVSKSARYCKGHPFSSVSPTEGFFLFLCDVAVGEKETLVDANPTLTAAPKGKKSVKCPGKRIPEPGCGMRFEGSYVWLGKTVESDFAENKLEYNEYTVYDPSQICMKYLIHFQFRPTPFVNPI